MLKKAGIVVATAAAALLAVSPLAFAHDADTNNNGSNSSGLFNVSDNNGAFAGQVCNNDVPIQGGVLQGQVPVKEITGALSGALGIFGSGTAVTDQDTDNSRECGDNTADAGDDATQDVG
ncbi:hypothetical protein ACQEVB_03280 [Pseudonocardia sp. CA-107938]|uniref:hypothetical protein n=1 Tax=Pseudonocardia sp. CA-107938 TaxID=3240021 RepID=UPI003D902809